MSALVSFISPRSGPFQSPFTRYSVLSGSEDCQRLTSWGLSDSRYAAWMHTNADCDPAVYSLMTPPSPVPRTRHLLHFRRFRRFRRCCQLLPAEFDRRGDTEATRPGGDRLRTRCVIMIICNCKAPVGICFGHQRRSQIRIRFRV